MVKSNIRKLVLFLLVNLILAIFIAVSYFFKTIEKPPAFVNQEQAIAVPSTVATPTIEPINTPTNSIPTPPPLDTNQTNILATIPTVEAPKVCVAYGPFNIEDKATMDFILNKNKQIDLAKIEKRNTHQIFWNLGNNKEEAEKIFNKQKEGAMADPKFTLTQNKDKDWVVNIVKVQGSNILADKLTKELGDKAVKINAGGKWEHIDLPEGYFFIFEDFQKLNQVTINSIEILLKPTKEPC